MRNKTTGDTPDTYYSRIWKKDNQGNWHIAVDTALPAQPLGIKDVAEASAAQGHDHPAGEEHGS